MKRCVWIAYALAAATAGSCVPTTTSPTNSADASLVADETSEVQTWAGADSGNITRPVPTQPPVTATASLPPSGHPLLLAMIAGEGGLTGAFLDPTSGEVTPGPSGYLPVSWSPSSDRLLLTDAGRHAYYVGTSIGQEPLLVLPAGYRAPDLVGWWLNDQEVLLPLHDPSAGHIGYSWYLVDTIERTVRPAGTAASEPSVIYAASPDGTYWVEEDTRGVQVVARDGWRTPLWPEGEVSVEQVPYPPRVAILPDASAVLFPGCTGSWAAQTLSCEIIRADLRDRELVSYGRIYHIGSHGGVMSLDVSSDGRRLAFYSYPEELVIVLDLNSLEVSRTLDLSGATADATLAWSPDSRVLAVSRALASGSEVVLVDVISGEERSIPIPDGYATILDWRNLPPR